MKSKLNALILFFLTALTAQAEFRPEEAVLYPAGSSSADVLKKSEIFFAPQGWVAYGLTDRWTLAWDWFLVFGGIPALQTRYALNGNTSHTRISLEAYSVYFPKDIPDKRDKEFIVNHRGGGGINYARLNLTQDFTERLRLHLYTGATSSDFEEFEPREEPMFEKKTYSSFVVPDYGLTFEYKVNSWLKVNLNASSGNTFVLFDQIAHKSMAVLGLYFAPFARERTGFLSNMRFELNAIAVRIPDADYKKFYPIYPVLSWQWNTNF